MLASHRGSRVKGRNFMAVLACGVAYPLLADAQQKAMPVIGLLSGSSPGQMAAFHQGLSETGYVEGQNLAIEGRDAEGHPDRFPALAADLVGRDVDVLVALSIDSVVAAKTRLA